MAVLETGAAPPGRSRSGRAGSSRREAWQRRLPLLPALIYIVVVTQIPFVVTLWYSFQNYFFDVPGGGALHRVQQLQAVFTNAAFRSSLLRSVDMTVDRRDRRHGPRGGVRGAA